jgi:DNA-binding NarL/FixJ family response regulator
MNTTLDQKNMDILIHLSQGLTAKEIACKVFLAEVTVIKRIEEMKERTGTKNRTELVFHYSEVIKQKAA